MAASVAWRNSASLIITRAGRIASEPELLWIKRGVRGGTFRGQYAFPGGVVDNDDFNPKWRSVLEQHGQRCMPSVYSRGPTPPVFDTYRLKSKVQKCSNSRTLDTNSLDVELAFKICAIRETFEETGLLLTHPAISPNANWDEVRAQISADALSFLSFCSEMNVAPATNRLALWSNWLTPAIRGWKRFDTVFFYVGLSEQEGSIFEGQSHTPCLNEITLSSFASPRVALETEMYAQMAPPQAYEVCRLRCFDTFGALEKFARHREQFGCSRYLTLMKNYRPLAADDKKLDASETLFSCGLFPGDYDYPSTGVDPAHEGVVPEVTRKELPPAEQRQNVPLHRIEYYKMPESRSSKARVIGRYACNLNDIPGVPEYLAQHAYPEHGFEINAHLPGKP